MVTGPKSLVEFQRGSLFSRIKPWPFPIILMILMSSSLGLEFIRLVNNGVNYICCNEPLAATASIRNASKVKNILYMPGQIPNEVASALFS